MEEDGRHNVDHNVEYGSAACTSGYRDWNHNVELVLGPLSSVYSNGDHNVEHAVALGRHASGFCTEHSVSGSSWLYAELLEGKGCSEAFSIDTCRKTCLAGTDSTPDPDDFALYNKYTTAVICSTIY